MKRAVIQLALALVLTAAAPSLQTLDRKPLSPSLIASEVGALRQTDGIPGIAVALIRDGRVVYLQASGVRDLAHGLPLGPDTVMRGASLSKATFAYMVMQLVDEGRIDLDRSIAAYLPKPLPDFPEYADLAGDPRWRKLTFRILLDHSSGFANYRSFEDDGKLRFHWAPGSRYGYSGEGINLAQFVLQQGLRLDIQREMQARVFDRFEMSRSFLIWRDDPQGEVAQGYSADRTVVNYEHTTAPNAASSLMTTPRDWSRFLAGVVRGDGLSADAKSEMIRLQVPIDSVRQFPTLAANRTAAYRSIKLGYGLGWGVFDTPYGHAFFKEGHDDGVANYALCVQPRRACILLMSNSERAEGVFKELVDRLMGPTRLPWAWEGYTPFYSRRTRPSETATPLG